MSPVVFFIWLLTQEVEAAAIPASHIIQTAISSKDSSSGKELAENNMPAEEAISEYGDFTGVKPKTQIVDLQLNHWLAKQFQVKLQPVL